MADFTGHPWRRETCRFRIDDAAAESYSPLGCAYCIKADKNCQLLFSDAFPPASRMALRRHTQT